MILSLLFSFRVVLSSLIEQIGCHRDGQDSKTKEAAEFSRDSGATRGGEQTPPHLPLSQNATPSLTGGQNPGEKPRAECGSVASCDTDRAPKESPQPGTIAARGLVRD